jgi:N-methylhydantoinase A
MRAQTVRRGLDPADYVLFAYGGAGPLHAVALARELGIGRVIVPELATVFSAYGIVASDILHALAQSEARPLEDVDAIARAYARLEGDGHRQLEADGVPATGRTLRRSAQIRFRGQLHAVDVGVAGGSIDSAFMTGVRADFLREYERLYGAGTASPEAGIEIITLRVDAIAATARPAIARISAQPRPARPSGTRTVWHEGRTLEADRYKGPLAPGDELSGPAVVDHPGHTLWVPPTCVARVDGWHNVVVEVA